MEIVVDGDACTVTMTQVNHMRLVFVSMDTVCVTPKLVSLDTACHVLNCPHLKFVSMDTVCMTPAHYSCLSSFRWTLCHACESNELWAMSTSGSSFPIPSGLLQIGKNSAVVNGRETHQGVPVPVRDGDLLSIMPVKKHMYTAVFVGCVESWPETPILFDCLVVFSVSINL